MPHPLCSEAEISVFFPAPANCLFKRFRDHPHLLERHCRVKRQRKLTFRDFAGNRCIVKPKILIGAEFLNRRIMDAGLNAVALHAFDHLQPVHILPQKDRKNMISRFHIR